MSDEGLVNLEDDSAPAPAPVAAAPEPIAAAPTETPQQSAPPAEEEPDGIDLNGQRMVPISALHAEREKRQQLSALAAKAQELEAWRRENEPALQFLQNNRDLLIQRVQQPEPVAPAAPQVDPDALEAARLMDFYRADGTPDIEKGQRWLALQDKRAGKLAEDRVRPILQQTAQDQANLNFQRALQIQDANGETPSRESLQAVWAAMPPDLVADQRVAGVLAATALGLDRMRTPRKAVTPPPPSAPLVTESVGGVPRLRPTLSPFEETIAKERGISATKWQEHTKNFQPGRPTALED